MSESSGVRTSDQSIQAVAGALKRAVDEARTVAAVVQAEVSDALARVELELANRRAILRRAEAEAVAARNRLATCRAADAAGHYFGLARATAQAEAARRAAAQRVEAAQAAHRAAQQLLSDHQAVHRRLLRALDAGQHGAADVQSLLSPLDRYRAVAAPEPSSAATAGILSPTARVAGLEMVDLSDVDDSDSKVTDASSFTKMSLQDARWATEALQDRLLPAIGAGKDRDYFAARDVAERRSADRSYARLYDTYFGSRAITLSLRPDGKLDVVAGYHRIWAARAAGLSQLPARVHR